MTRTVTLSSITNDLQIMVATVREYLAGAKKQRLSDCLIKYQRLNEEYDALDSERKKIGAMIEEMSRQIIPEMMSEEGIKTITIEEVGRRFTVANRISASMPDKEGGMAWLRENGHEDLIQETVNSSSLSSFAKSYMEDAGMDLPEGLFKISTLRYVSSTKA